MIKQSLPALRMLERMQAQRTDHRRRSQKLTLRKFLPIFSSSYATLADADAVAADSLLSTLPAKLDHMACER